MYFHEFHLSTVVYSMYLLNYTYNFAKGAKFHNRTILFLLCAFVHACNVGTVDECFKNLTWLTNKLPEYKRSKFPQLLTLYVYRLYHVHCTKA